MNLRLKKPSHLRRDGIRGREEITCTFLMIGYTPLFRGHSDAFRLFPDDGLETSMGPTQVCRYREITAFIVR